MSSSSSSEESSSSSSEIRCGSPQLLLDSDRNIIISRVTNPGTNQWSDFNNLHARWRNLQHLANDAYGSICSHDLPLEPDPDDFQEFD